MKKVQLLNDDYVGHVTHLRHACRGIVMNDGKVLLCYEKNNGLYLIPGGGVEEGESYKQCCERELLEETGMQVFAKEEYLEIEELFSDWQHFNHYFICDLIKNTGCVNLTEGEKDAGCTYVWLPLEEAVDVFSVFEDFHKTDIAKYGLYKREHQALKEFSEIL